MAEIWVQAIAPEEFLVRVTEDGSHTEHLVKVTRQALERYGCHAGGKRLVEETFRFLLEHEEKEAIMHSFELHVLDRYYPGYREEIRERLGPAPMGPPAAAAAP
jgi:hypothetical protein